MKLHVSDEARKGASACKKNHACLNGKPETMCPVERFADKKVLFVQCKNEERCAYKRPFGEGYFCSCPVRKELYESYSI